MKLISKTDARPYMNVIFGNFYCPAYEDEAFVDETMKLIKELGFNSVMFDTKAWEDFKERYETGALSQYVKMQEYMGQSALSHGLSYNFLLLYLNGDNLYPHIRFSPPILGEETVHADGSPGRWYKYWSKKAQLSMQEHVGRIMERYGAGCERCLTGNEGEEKTVIPVCSMWDPVVAPSFDEEGIGRYRAYLAELYGGNIEKLNRNYCIKARDFDSLRPEEYWHELRYGQGVFYTEEDVKRRSPRFLIFRDNAQWRIRELVRYFKEMHMALKEKNQNLFLCPDMSQWGYFLNIYGRQQVDSDNEYSDLWDTAVRGIDLYALAPYVDSCHFITVPVTPDGCPDAYVTSCQHSMMRVMNEGRPLVGGIYWGRYIYQDIYACLTPAEMIGTMAACGADGYTCYGMNGLDDGGVLNRMEPDFLESLAAGNRWFAKVLAHRRGGRKKEIAILFPSEMANYEPYEVGDNKIRRLDLLGWYKICCDLGYQADVLSGHEIERDALYDYKVLIVAANDCYGAQPHEESECKIREWVKSGGVVIHGPGDELAAACFGILGEPCKKMPYRYGQTVIPQGVMFNRYHTGESVAEYVDGGGCCVARHEGAAAGGGLGRGTVYSMGVQIGASYAAKNIPHVPYEQGNKEMYPFIQSRTTLIRDILERHISPKSGIRERGIETGVFENGMIIVNHRSTPYVLPQKYLVEQHQYPPVRGEDGRSVLAGHTAVWVSGEA